jgi:hypothetical protein
MLNTSGSCVTFNEKMKMPYDGFSGSLLNLSLIVSLSSAKSYDLVILHLVCYILKFSSFNVNGNKSSSSLTLNELGSGETEMVLLARA